MTVTSLMIGMVKKDLKNIQVLDLFCGAGGFSIGFNKNNFSVTGVDINPWSEKIFKQNHIGSFIPKDLFTDSIEGNFDIIMGGPPCRPFSSVNLTRRGENHPDYQLVERYFDHIHSLEPDLFFMENVPPVQGYPVFTESVEKIMDDEYYVKPEVIHYSDFGAATKRRRLIVFGGKSKRLVKKIMKEFNGHKKDPKSVGEAIKKYENMAQGEFSDHVWPLLKTIDKYREKYLTGKYGWYKLEYDKPAHSFGNVMKTYILHPNSWNNGTQPRVISIREAMEIMGFQSSFIFPENMGVGIRYQMVVDVVSPMISDVLAKAVKECYVKTE